MENFVQWLHEQALVSQPANRAVLRRYLVDQLGYSNRGKAFRRIDALLQHGRLDNELRDRLAAILHITAAVIDQKIGAAHEEVRRCQRERLFASTGPQLIAIVPRPRQILFAGLISDCKRYLSLPSDLPQFSDEKQQAFLQQAIAAFIAREGTSISLFGPISGFAYINSPHTHWILDTQGLLVEQRDEPFANRVFTCRLA